MVTTFAAPAGIGASAGTPSKGGNTVLYVALLAVAAFASYKFLYIPWRENKKRLEELQKQSNG